MPPIESGDTRSRILETARELFTTQTYRAASMRDIAERVGITKPSLYHHFRSKSEILASLVTPPIDQLEAAVTDAAAGSDPAEVRQRVLGGCLEVMLAHRATMVLLLRDASVYSEETTEVVSRVVAVVNRAIELLAGPDPDWRRRVRAAQAFAAATDPIGQLPDVPAADLRAELLRGASVILELDEPAAGPQGSDRRGRSAAHVPAELRERGVKAGSLTENVDLDTKEGRFMFAVLAAAAEYELESRAEPQAEGIAEAKLRQES